METMNYYTYSAVTLNDIEVLAQNAGYSSKRITYFKREQLNIYFGQDRYMRWEWRKYEAEELAIEEDARGRLSVLKPATILLFEYYPRWLPEVIKFMIIVLKKYGGYLDCKGDVQDMYTLNNVNGLLTGCP